MRTRSRVLNNQVHYGTLHVSREAPSTPTLDKSTWCDFMSQRTMVDQPTPGYFKAHREKTVIPVSPMSATSVIWSGEPGLFEGKSTAVVGGGFPSTYANSIRANGFFTSGQLVVDASLLPVGAPEAVPKEALLQNALARAQTDAWDVATFLAELGETVEMFRTASDRYKDHLLRVRLEAERRQGTLAGRLRTLADLFAEVWLELRYGVRPIIYDLLEIQRVIHKLSNGIESPLARGWNTWEGAPELARKSYTYGSLMLLGNPPSGTQRFDASSAKGGWWVYASGELWTGHLLERKRQRIARATVGVRVITRNLTMVDLPVTTWERVPASFILDWFFTIGDAIAAFSPAATGIFEYATFSERYIDEHTVTSTPIMAVSDARVINSTITAQQSVIRCTSESYARTIPASINPTLSVNVDLDAAKITDLVAILYGFASGYLSSLKLNKRLPKEFRYRPAKSKTLKTIRFSRS